MTLETCLGLVKDESFLLIYDETSRDFVPVFQRVSRTLGVRFHRAFVSVESQASGNGASQSHLVNALRGAHGVLVATTDDERCTAFRITLTGERRQANSAMATMPGASLEILATAIKVNYPKIISRCRDLTLPLIKGRHCEIQTFDRLGSKYTLRFRLPGPKRPPIQSYGIIARQAWGNVPAGETFIAPLEDSAEGEYLVNGAVGKETIRSNNEAVLCFRGGRLFKHYYLSNEKPVRYLTRLQAIAERGGQGACWAIIAEFGIGVNEAIKRITGVQLVDEKRYGTVHIAIGHNRGYGGSTNCGTVHCDITTVAPTVIIDGKPIIERGKHIESFSCYKENFRMQAPRSPFAWNHDRLIVHLNEDSYELDSLQRLWVKRRTSSGRETVYAIGDDETSQLAFKMVSAFKGELSMPLDRMEDVLGIPEGDCKSLLTVLLDAGIVTQ